MNSHYMWYFFGRVLIFSLLTSLCSALYAKETLHISLGDNYGKHAMRIDGKPAGIQKDLLTWFLLQHMKLDLAIEAMPWKRSQARVVDHKTSDGYFTAYTKKRVEVLKLIPSAKPFYTTRAKMHTWKNNPKLKRLRALKTINELQALEDIKHVIINGHGYHEELFRNVKQVNRLINPEQVPRYLLYYKRADLFVEQSELFYPLLAEEGLTEQIVTLDNLNFKSLDWHLFIRPDSKHADIMEQVNQELERVS